MSLLVNILRGHISFLLFLSNKCNSITCSAGSSWRIFRRTSPPVNRPILFQVCILEKSKYIKLEGGCYHALAANCTSHLVYTKDVLGEISHLDWKTYFDFCQHFSTILIRPEYIVLEMLTKYGGTGNFYVQTVKSN